MNPTLTFSERYLQGFVICRRVGEGDVLENYSSLQLLRSQVSLLLTLWPSVKIAKHCRDDLHSGHRVSKTIQNLLDQKQIIVNNKITITATLVVRVVKSAHM